MVFWRRSKTVTLPDDWEDIVARHVSRWWDFPVEDRTRLRDLMVRLISEKRWESSKGFELTEEIKLVVASQAALLVLGLDFEHYRKVGAIIMHPTTMVLTGVRAGAGPGLVTDEPIPILGQAVHSEGPVVIAWDEAERNARHPERGFNVVFHEFAHKLDMLDGVVDGTPPLASVEQHERWVEVCTDHYRAVQEGRGSPLLRDYAGVNPGEFFAVVTEVFFDRAAELQRHERPLYDVLAAYYNQDPASWESRAR